MRETVSVREGGLCLLATGQHCCATFPRMRQSMAFVPAVLVLGGITGTDVILGLEPFEMVLLALTLILSYPHARLTGIEGLMKLVIFLFWILLQVA